MPRTPPAPKQPTEAAPPAPAKPKAAPKPPAAQEMAAIEQRLQAHRQARQATAMQLFEQFQQTLYQELRVRVAARPTYTDDGRTVVQIFFVAE